MDFLDRAKDEMLAVRKLVPDFGIYPREDALYFEAVDATVSKDTAAAVRGYEEIVKLTPEHAPAHLDLGRAYERDLLTDKALASYTEAIRLDSSYAAAYLRLGALHARLGNPAGASGAFERAEKLYAERVNPEGKAAMHYLRGRFLLINQQKPAEARAEFERALALASETNNTYQKVQTLLQLALTLNDGAAARKTAEDAVALAQASGMNDQVANGYITVSGIIFSKLGKYDEALAAYNQALQFARSYKLKRYEALALFNKGSVLYQLTRYDEAEPPVTEAREFFRQAGYRREAEQCAMLLARIKRRRGNYAEALNIFEELLRSANRAGDVGQAGTLHRECAGVFEAQEKYFEALAHYKESAVAARTLDLKSLLTYSLLGQADVLWPLGHYDEAAGLYRQLAGGDSQASISKEMLTDIRLGEAMMELSRRRFREAAAAASQALALLKETEEPSERIALDGQRYPRAGRKLRRLADARPRAVRGGGASRPGHQRRRRRALAALARPRATQGGRRRGRARGVAARTGDLHPAGARRLGVACARRGRARPAVWPATQTAAREYLSRAAAALAQLEQSLGAEAAGYLSRPDVQWLRSEFGVSQASAAH